VGKSLNQHSRPDPYFECDPYFEWLGRQPYQPMWLRMQQRAAAVSRGEQHEIIWTCEHEPVYTTGRRGIDNRRGNMLPAPLVVTDRGGETTFHGPGQLMLYPVIDLRRRGLGVKQYVHLLEQSCMDFLAGKGLMAQRRCGFPGVWLDDAKVAALGVRVAHGVAYHGMALNVDVDDAWFTAIQPCGLRLPVASLAQLGVSASLSGMASEWYDSLSGLLHK